MTQVCGIYKNLPEQIVWDVYPEEFTADGCFESLIQYWKTADFQELVFEELDRVRPFLRSWSALLATKHGITVEDLEAAFCKAPSVSGVLYCSHSTVLSEAFFMQCPPALKHLTDRVISPQAAERLASAKDLSFSFPRKYSFAGFYNSWGFVRIERQNSQSNGVGVLLSVVTLDPQILQLLKENSFSHLAHLYNQSWNGAVHDYIHHLALYTNPSFGMGKKSPLSLLQKHQAIDAWGVDMVDTFNYEYWAHRTHRLITSQMTEICQEQIIEDATRYFYEVARFQRVLVDSGLQLERVHRVGEYLGSVYLWPLAIRIPPYGDIMDKIAPAIEELILPAHSDKCLEAASLLSQEHLPKEATLRATILLGLIKKMGYLQDKERFDAVLVDWVKPGLDRLQRLVHLLEEIVSQRVSSSSELIEALNLHSVLFFPESPFLDTRKWCFAFLELFEQQKNSPLLQGISWAIEQLRVEKEQTSFTKSDWLRFKVNITVQRGMYNCWGHEYPVIFQKAPTDPLTVFAEVFPLLKQAILDCQEAAAQGFVYELSGICP